MLKTKRLVGLVILVLFFITSYLNFSVNETNVLASSEQPTVRFLVEYADYYNTYQSLDIISRYKRYRPNVNLIVDYINYPDSKFDEAIRRYDVLIIPALDNIISSNTAELANLNNLQAVKDNIFAQEAAVKGNVYGIPCTARLELVWYRKSIFKEYDLAVPKTWDEFLKASIRIRDGKKYIPIALGKQDNWPNIMFTKSLACLENGSGQLWNNILNESNPFSKGKPAYNAINKFKTLVDNKLFSTGTALSITNESIDLFVNRKAAMLCWREYIRSRLPGDSDIGCFFLPARTGNTDKYNVTANIDSYIVVNRNCSNNADVMDFVNWHFSSEWYKPFLSQRGYTSLQKGIKADYPLVVQEAFNLAGSNLCLVAPNLTNAEFNARLYNSRINFLEIGADLFAGRGLDDLCNNLNRQWAAARVSGPPISADKRNVGQYALSKQSEELRYVPHAVNTSYAGPDIKSPRDINSSIDNSVIIHADYPYAYAYSVKTRIDKVNRFAKPILKDGQFMVPVDFLKDAFGAEINKSNTSSIEISYGENSAVLALDKAEMLIGTRKIKLGTSPRLINSILYIPLNGIAENILNKKAIYSGSISILYSDEAAPGKDEEKAYIDRAAAIFRNDGLLRVTIDPRVELFKIMELLSNTGNNRLTSYDSAYRREVVDYFLPYINHPSIKYVRTLNQGYINQMLSVIMNYSAPPSLTRQVPLSSEFKNMGINENQAERFVYYMRIFAFDTGYINFYSKNHNLYRLITQKVEKNAQEGKYIERLTSYYGTRLQSYNTILAPLLAMVSVGPHVEWEKGKVDTYNIITSLQPEGEIPAFGTRERLRGIIWHEFGHSYINSLVESQWDELSGLSSLVKLSHMPDNYGNDWKICVCEHLVRAVTVRLVYAESGKEAGNRELQAQKNEGFMLIEDICRELELYEKNRSRYPTFTDFYPKIIEMFKREYNERQKAE